MGNAFMDKSSTISNGSSKYYSKNAPPNNKYSVANSAEKPKNNQFNATQMKFNSADMSQGHNTSKSVNKTVGNNYSTLDPIDMNGNF